jgi:ADP-ribosylglycohydrolase
VATPQPTRAPIWQSFDDGAPANRMVARAWCVLVRTSMPDIRLERARASLLGLAIGDAFGEALSNQSEAERRAAIRLMPRHRPWRWTDDTAMALSIVDVLEHHETIDVDALSAAFVRRFVADPTAATAKARTIC